MLDSTGMKIMLLIIANLTDYVANEKNKLFSSNYNIQDQ